MPSATNDALRLLIDERDRLDQAIRLLQGGETEQPRPRRGRPPKSASKKAAQKSTKRQGRPPMSAAEKKAASERMKKYWADRKAAKGGEAAKARKATKKGKGRGRKAAKKAVQAG